MKFKRGLSLLTFATITTAPIAAVISCSSEAAPLSMEGAVVSEDVVAATADETTRTNPFKLNCLPFADNKILFTQTELDAFREDLFKNKLYFGPEAWDLKSITLDPGAITSGSQLGVYYPASKQIFINISDLEGVKLSDAEDVIAKVIAHEYGHHMFATYANGYRSRGTNIDPVVKKDDKFVYDKTGDVRYISPWNKKYFDTFVTDYHMQDPYTEPPKTYQENNINSIFSLKDLFNNSNQRDAKLTWKTAKVTYASSKTLGGKAASYAVSVAKDNEGSLKYIYSIDEQVTRKMQMMFYPGLIKTGTYSFDSSLLKVSAGQSTYFDPYAVDWMRTADLYTDGSKISKAPIYSDDIFVNNKVDEAYNSILSLMGYGKQISHMYSRNTAKVSDSNSVVGLSKDNDNHVRISGYVDPSQNYDYIGDEDGNVITKMYVSNSFDQRFKFNHKNTWDATKATVGPNDKSKFSYITDEFNVRDFEGKKLYFYPKGWVKGSPRTEITDINDYGGSTNVNSYDSQRPYNDKYFQIVEDGGTAKVKGYL